MAKDKGPYRYLPRVCLLMVGLAAGVWSLAVHLDKVQGITQGATGASAVSFLGGDRSMPRQFGDPSAQAMDVVRKLTGGDKAGAGGESEAKLVLFGSDPNMSEAERARLMAEAERLRPKLPEQPARQRRNR